MQLMVRISILDPEAQVPVFDVLRSISMHIEECITDTGEDLLNYIKYG